MSGKVEFKTCCGCLKDADLSTMYYFVDPGVLDLYQECTNIWVQMEKAIPQQLCVLCYKQCELFKYFKQQCEESYTKSSSSSTAKSKKWDDPPLNVPAPVTVYMREKAAAPIQVKEEPLEEIADNSDSEQYQEEDQDDNESEELSEPEPMDDDDDEDYEDIPRSSVKIPSAPRIPKTVDTSNSSEPPLPDKSRRAYMRTYDDFTRWKVGAGVAGETTEEVLLSYFQHLLDAKMAGSTLEQRMSHLKSTLMTLHGISIDGFTRLRELVKVSKTTNPSTTRKKAPMMTRHQMMRFVKEAPNEYYGTTKVAVALWLAGCVKPVDIYALKRTNVFDRGGYLELLDVGVGVKKSEYVIKPSMAEGYNPIPMIRQYLADAEEDFPWLLRNKLNIRTGMNSVKAMPKVVAKFLKLKDPSTYTNLSIPKHQQMKIKYERIAFGLVQGIGQGTVQKRKEGKGLDRSN